MKLIELIKVGDFASWDQQKLDEIKKQEFSETIGNFLFENEEIKLSQIILEPKERIPFRRHLNSYSCTFLTDGQLVSRNINGQIGLIRAKKGDILFWECHENEMIHDLENLGEETVKITVVEQKTI